MINGGNHARRRACALTLAAALALAACGGGDDDTSADGADDDTSAVDADDGATTDDGDGPDQDASDTGDTGASSDEPAAGGGLEFDGSALPTSSLDSAVLALPSGGGSNIPAVVDTCAVLPASEVSRLTDEVDAEFGLGTTYDFAATSDGATCRYETEFHVIDVVIGPADVVTADSPSDAIPEPVMAGEISATPWADDSSVTIISEDSFDLDTPYAAHASAGDLGVAVRNAAGTGVDASTDGVLFARIAQLAAANAADAPRLDGGSADAAPASVGDPCGWYTVDEIAAFVPKLDITTDADITQENACIWSGPGGEVAIRLEAAYLAVSLAPNPVGSTGFVFVGDGNPYVIDDPVGAAEIDIYDYEGFEVDTTAAETALAENLASRFG